MHIAKTKSTTRNPTIGSTSEAKNATTEQSSSIIFQNRVILTLYANHVGRMIWRSSVVVTSSSTTRWLNYTQSGEHEELRTNGGYRTGTRDVKEDRDR